MPLLPFLKQYPKINIAYEKRDNLFENEKIHQILTISRYIYNLASDKKEDASIIEILSYPFFNLPMLEVIKTIDEAKQNKQSIFRRISESDNQGIAQIANFFAELKRISISEPLEIFIDHLIGASPIDKYRSPFLEYYSKKDSYETYSLYENIASLRGKLNRHFGEKSVKLTDLIEMLDDYEMAEAPLTTTSPYKDTEDAVQVLSAHKAKGLEFEYVFIISTDHMAWGKGKGNNDLLKLPKNLQQIRHTGTSDGEKLRILYVAMTRAKKSLTITNSLRDFNGKSPDRLEYFNEYEKDDKIISPYIPNGYVETEYETATPEIARENIINKKQIKNVKSKIKEQVDNDKKNYYNKRNEDNNDYYKKNKNKPIEKINYAISYDKNLEPELIEKTTINKNKKGGKKIVEKMTQEEYEQKFPDEEQNIENEYEEEDDDNNNEQNYDENEEEEYYEAQNNEQNYNIKNYKMQNNYQNKDRKNLYHYKTDINNTNNSIINNTSQGSKNNDVNPEMMQNPQQSFNQKNNYINIVNNSNEPQYMKYNYNPNPSEQYNNNYKVGMSESDDKSSKYIGIEQKYQKKIDELEKNIINPGGNNIDNYANKLQVNITNMEEYSKNNNNNNEEYQNIDEENENEENNLSDMDLNEMNEGVLSQMSNMSERTKDLFKRTMDEYPPLEEDTLYEQSQNK